MKTILILGGGFIGKAIAIRLIHLNFNVKVISKNDPKITGIDFRKSLLSDFSQHQDFFSNVDIVIHAISTSVPYTSMLNIEQDVEDNILANVRLLNFLVTKNIPKFIYISSGGAIYGNPKTDLINEKHPTNPLSSYGITKLTTEKYLSLYQDHYNLKAISLRPSNIYGNGQGIKKPQGIIGHISNSLKTGAPVTIWGDGEGKKDYLHIDDFVDAMINVINNNNYTEKVYNISSGECFSTNEIVDLIEQITSKKVKLEFSDHKKFDIPSIKLDNSLFKETFNWTPKTSFDNGLKLYLTNVL